MDERPWICKKSEKPVSGTELGVVSADFAKSGVRRCGTDGGRICDTGDNDPGEHSYFAKIVLSTT